LIWFKKGKPPSGWEDSFSGAEGTGGALLGARGLEGVSAAGVSRVVE